jgi:hypothetical protein
MEIVVSTLSSSARKKNFLVRHQKSSGRKFWKSFVQLVYYNLCGLYIEKKNVVLSIVSLAHKFSTLPSALFSEDGDKEENFSCIVETTPLNTLLTIKGTLKNNLTLPDSGCGTSGPVLEEFKVWPFVPLSHKSPKLLFTASVPQYLLFLCSHNGFLSSPPFSYFKLYTDRTKIINCISVL